MSSPGAEGEQRRLGGRAQRLAGLLVVAETGPGRSQTTPGNRSRRRCARTPSGRSTPARQNRGSACVADWCCRRTGSRGSRRPGWHAGILRAAVVLRECGQHRAALLIALEAADAAAAQPFEAGGDLVQVAAHLLDLVVDRTALRRLVGEQREEAGAVAAHALGLRGDAVELGRLPGRGFLIAADLLGAGRIPAAAVDRRKLALEPLADRIGRASRPAGRRPDVCARWRRQHQHAACRAERAQARIAAAEARREWRFRHHPRPLRPRRGRWRTDIAASCGEVTSFPRRRMWRTTGE